MDREFQRKVDHDAQCLEESARRFGDRRAFLRKGAYAAGGAGLLLAGCTGSEGAAGAASEVETAAVALASSGAESEPASETEVAQAETGEQAASIVDRAVDGDTIRLGADLTFPPLQFGTPEAPEGYAIELAVMMMEDLEATFEIIEVPFGELFPSLAAGRFDFAGIAATILPTRAQQVMFSSFPAFVESNVILRNNDSPVQTVADLNSADVTIAVLVGSAQEASAQQLFPEATLTALEQQPAVQEAATGRADVVFLGEFNVAEVLEQSDTLSVLEGPPITADINTYFMPVNDFRMKAYVDNWLNYNAIRGTLAGMWNQFVGDAARAAGIATVPVQSPWLPAGASGA